MVERGDDIIVGDDVATFRFGVEGDRALIEYLDGRTDIVDREDIEKPEPTLFDRLRDIWHP